MPTKLPATPLKAGTDHITKKTMLDFIETAKRSRPAPGWNGTEGDPEVVAARAALWRAEAKAILRQVPDLVVKAIHDHKDRVRVMRVDGLGEEQTPSLTKLEGLAPMADLVCGGLLEMGLEVHLERDMNTDASDTWHYLVAMGWGS